MRVAHFEPNKVNLTGEGVFPRVIFDLPHDKEDYRYEELTRQARESLGREKSNMSEKTVDNVSFRALADVSTACHNTCTVLFLLSQSKDTCYRVKPCTVKPVLGCHLLSSRELSRSRKLYHSITVNPTFIQRSTVLSGRCHLLQNPAKHSLQIINVYSRSSRKRTASGSRKSICN